MKPVFQSKFGAEECDCLSAAIASVLEWDLEDVPNFSLFGGQFYPKLWQWLKECNLGIIGVDNCPSGYHMIRVKSPRIEGHYHELVGYNGKPIHDPYPSGNCEGEKVWYDILYLLDISKPIQKIKW